jgi:hypothetical protein
MVIRDKLVVDFLPQSAQGRHKEHKGFIVCLEKILVFLVVRMILFRHKVHKGDTKSTKNS